MTTGWVGGDGGIHVSEGAVRTKSAGRYQQHGDNHSISECNTGTVSSGADVSGHARPPLPRPAVRADADSVLRVHFEVGDLHILARQRTEELGPGVEEIAVTEEERENNGILTGGELKTEEES